MGDERTKLMALFRSVGQQFIAVERELNTENIVMAKTCNAARAENGRLLEENRRLAARVQALEVQLGLHRRFLDITRQFNLENDLPLPSYL